MVREEDNGFAQWGGYFEAKKSKLEEQFTAASDPFRQTNLFQGISIFVNGYTNPSSEELKRLMMVHGGTYHIYERPHTNFIIASVLPDVKVRNMNTSNIISAQWIVDCIAQMRILDYSPYLLYTNQKKTQPRLQFKNTKNDESIANKSNSLDGVLKELHQVATTTATSNESTKLPIKTSDESSSSSSAKNPARTAVDPLFLSEFYKNSRLHHIATLGAGFKQYVSELRQAHGTKPFAKRSELTAMRRHCDPIVNAPVRYVMHIDMDCFFVSVGLRKHPEMRGLPVAVTHSKGGSSATAVPVHPQADRQLERELYAQRFEQVTHDNVRAEKVRRGFEEKTSLSEIASCSYEARARGIRNGMFVGQAMQLCPDLKTIPYDFEGYREVAFTLYDTVAQYTLNIEAVSCDEMFVELTDFIHDMQLDVMAFIGHLRQEVRQKTGCPCSAGVAENKLLARMATKLAKPNGQHLLQAEDVPSFMATTELQALPGVGHGMAHKLNQAGLKTCGDVQKISLDSLEALLGKKSAQTVYQNCHGIDPRPLVYEQQRKSVSAEVNYGIRFSKSSECEAFMQQLSAEVHNRLTEIKRKTKHITLKLMVRAKEAPVETSKFMGHGFCDNLTKSVSLNSGTNDINIITSHVMKMMTQFGVPPQELRGIGIQLSKLEEIIDENKKGSSIMKMFAKMSEKQSNGGDKTKEKIMETAEQQLLPVVDKQETKPQGRKTVLDMMNKAANSKNSMAHKPAISKEETANAAMEFDAEVLAQLPEDIRREVLNSKEQYLQIVDSKNAVKKQNNATNVSLLNESDFLPSTSKAAKVKQQKRLVEKEKKAKCELNQIVKSSTSTVKTPPKKTPMTSNLAEKKSVKSRRNTNILWTNNFKPTLASWVDQISMPLPADLELLNKTINEFIYENEMDQLYEVMKYLCRLIKSKRRDNCFWHLAFSHIEQSIQTQMQNLYAYGFLLGDTIKCSKCM